MMRPLCIGFLGADWWGSDARAMAAMFRRRGHLVLERNYEDYFPTRWQHPVLKAFRRGLRPVMARDYNRAVAELAEIRTLDFLLVFKGMLLKPSTLSLFRQGGVPCYCFYPDVSFEDHGANIPGCLPLYDRIFTTKEWHLQGLVSMPSTVKSMEFAPHGFDPEVHRPIDGGDMESPYHCVVSFVGHYSRKKESTLEGLLEKLPDLDLKIWGPGWKRAGGRVAQRWQGRGAYGDELAAIYSHSKINLGLLSEAGKGTGKGDTTTARTYQIPGAGGFLLHEDTPEIREFFEAEVEVGLFAGAADLPQKVTWFLENEAVRIEVARRGFARAHEEPYTYGRAVERILSWHLQSPARGSAGSI